MDVLARLRRILSHEGAGENPGLQPLFGLIGASRTSVHITKSDAGVYSGVLAPSRPAQICHSWPTRAAHDVQAHRPRAIRSFISAIQTRNRVRVPRPYSSANTEDSDHSPQRSADRCPSRTTNESSRPLLKLWITPELYIPVDDRGYCHTYSEGALGAVVQIRRKGSEECYALKIPRLLSDTLRENAYIEELMLSEYRNVKQIQPNSTTGLLGVQAFDQRLQGPILSNRSLTEDGSAVERATEAHRAGLPYLIFARFEKTRAPRFCAAWEDKGQVSCWPRDAASVCEPNTSPSTRDTVGDSGALPITAHDIQALLRFSSEGRRSCVPPLREC